MPYKIHKLVDDNRNHTCGFMIPNGGFYWVEEMTFENFQQLTNLSRRPGYSVDFVEGPTGFYDVHGYEVDPSTLVIHKVSKIVEDYKRKTKKSRGKEVEVKAKHVSTERAEAIEAARRLGFAVSEKASTQTIKAVSNRGVQQSSLRVSL